MQKLPDMLPSSPRICQCRSSFFVKRPNLLAATSNLRVEENLVHLGRFLHFSQKVVGVTLNHTQPFKNTDLNSEKDMVTVQIRDNFQLLCLEERNHLELLIG